MLPLIISCTRSWNFAWHIFWHLTTESKHFVKLLAICQTIYNVCFKDDYFPKGKFKLFGGLFHSGYLVFSKCLFSIADLFAVRYLLVLCTRPWSVAWHLLWSSTNSNSWQSAKPFTPCAARTIIFQRENLNYFIVCFTQCTRFYKTFVFFSWFVCRASSVGRM